MTGLILIDCYNTLSAVFAFLYEEFHNTNPRGCELEISVPGNKWRQTASSRSLLVLVHANRDDTTVELGAVERHDRPRRFLLGRKANRAVPAVNKTRRQSNCPYEN